MTVYAKMWAAYLDRPTVVWKEDNGETREIVRRFVIRTRWQLWRECGQCNSPLENKVHCTRVFAIASQCIAPRVFTVDSPEGAREALFWCALCNFAKLFSACDIYLIFGFLGPYFKHDNCFG